MLKLYAVFYQRFALAAFFSGIIGGVGSGLITQPSVSAIAAGCMHILAAALLAWLHSIFAEVDATATVTSAAGGGIVGASALVEEMLGARRKQVWSVVAASLVLFGAASVLSNDLLLQAILGRF